MNEIPTTTVRLDEAVGFAGWTAELRPGTTRDPRPALVIADVAGVIQTAERIDGIDDADREEVWEPDGAQTSRCVDIIVDPTILDRTLRRATGQAAAAMPGAARLLIRAADAAWWQRTFEAEEAARPTAPAPVPAPETTEADDDAWQF